jgi:hypothetical protein
MNSQGDAAIAWTVGRPSSTSGAVMFVLRPAEASLDESTEQATNVAVSVLLKVMADSATPASVKVRAADSVFESLGEGH